MSEHDGEWVVEVYADDGRRLLGIRYDGTWVVEPEDAPEAARVFAQSVAEVLASRTA